MLCSWNCINKLVLNKNSHNKNKLRVRGISFISALEVNMIMMLVQVLMPTTSNFPQATSYLQSLQPRHGPERTETAKGPEDLHG